MRHGAKVTIITIACVIVVGATAAFAAPVVYRGFFAAPAAKVPSLTVDDSALDPGTGDALDPDALTGTWELSEGSVAGYRVDEVLNGTEVTVTGRTSQVTGTVTADGFTLTDASLQVDMASVETDSPQRDGYFRDQALRTSEFPTATFELSKPAAAASEPKSGEPLKQNLVGKLTIAGVTRTVDVPVQMSTDGNAARVAGRVHIVFKDFGVNAPDLGFVKVEPEGYVEFDLRLTKQ